MQKRKQTKEKNPGKAFKDIAYQVNDVIQLDTTILNHQKQEDWKNFAFFMKTIKDAIVFTKNKIWNKYIPVDTRKQIVNILITACHCFENIERIVWGLILDRNNLLQRQLHLKNCFDYFDTLRSFISGGLTNLESPKVPTMLEVYIQLNEVLTILAKIPEFSKLQLGRSLEPMGIQFNNLIKEAQLKLEKIYLQMFPGGIFQDE